MSLLTAAQIAERLAQIAPEVAGYLLPNGKLQAGEWCVGDLAGGTGESLKVRVAGSKAGIWSDFAEGVGGDLLDLWAQTRGLSIIEAMREAGEYLGVAAPGITSRPPPTVRPPQGATKASADDAVWQWLTNARKLPDASLNAYRVAAHKGAAMFPAFTPDGKAIQYLKFRVDHREEVLERERERAVPVRLAGHPARCPRGCYLRRRDGLRCLARLRLPGPERHQRRRQPVVDR